MPTNRKRITRNRRAPPMDPTLWALLNGEPLEPHHNKFRAITFERVAPKLWTVCGAEILERWIAKHPGTRPKLWWKFDAPRVLDSTLSLPVPRQRVGGKGTPCFAALAYMPEFEFGLPSRWVADADINYYGNELDVERFDPRDPPAFESEAHYLRRLELLLPGERERLKRTDFKPQVLPRDYWPT